MNLAAVPAQNMATQLFGTEHGGETTAGVFEQAGGGTLFLDQIGDLDLATQSRLLNVLEEKRFMRGRRQFAGNARCARPCRHQPGSRTGNREGRFREDLFYRLNVVPLVIPSLREHREDVPELVSFYVDWMVEKESLPYRRFTTGALNALRNHAWPGNIRELKNLVQRLLILSQGEEVTEADVAAALGAQKTMVSMEAIPAALFDLPLREARDHFEKAYLEHHLKLAA